VSGFYIFSCESEMNDFDTDDLYVGNVGWNAWEAIDRISVAGQNFGCPCYEG